ncbi:hypothetical protein [Azospirillum soli]|uniref:hypothetical protein n=1 Tax=Azospirillum soli TaxID=1304799 RepID=UPI001AE24256|nr:hypothetical protein [Azospirillum soli]MBP2312701.1 hypothetical protein [Azospirillum soli]
MWIAIAVLLGGSLGVSIPAIATEAAATGAGATQRWVAPSAIVSTTGTGILKLCRDWMIVHSCREYGDIDIPARVAIGDEFEITFGSNPKTIRFQVKGVLLQDHGCLLIPNYESMPADLSPDPTSDMVIVKDCTVIR